MRIVLRAAAVAAVALALAAPARAACSGNCEPSVEDARAAMQQIFKETFLSPYTLMSFERLDGRSGERYGGAFYEMRIRAVVHYDDYGAEWDELASRDRLSIELATPRQTRTGDALFVKWEGAFWPAHVRSVASDGSLAIRYDGYGPE